MVDCDRVRPLLFRFHEGEASPEEAMLVARHLSDCTGCRILLARENRLAKILAEEMDDLPVGEDFVRSVMATLPNEPPPRPITPTQRRLRGLKLA
jgi:predicted anti-sigma-YlaC factor YlaD